MLLRALRAAASRLWVLETHPPRPAARLPARRKAWLAQPAPPCQDHGDLAARAQCAPATPRVPTRRLPEAGARRPRQRARTQVTPAVSAFAVVHARRICALSRARHTAARTPRAHRFVLQLRGSQQRSLRGLSAGEKRSHAIAALAAPALPTPEG
jgi:hypothetical protein